jgi:hypothetical protein
VPPIDDISSSHHSHNIDQILDQLGALATVGLIASVAAIIDRPTQFSIDQENLWKALTVLATMREAQALIERLRRPRDWSK